VCRDGYGIRVSFGKYVLPALAVTALATGCGDDANRPVPSAEALVEPAQIARAGRNSPKGVLLQLWRAVQVGNAASAAGFYDQRVLRAIGFGKVSGALAQQRSHLEVLRPTNITGSRTFLGFEVVVKGDNTVKGTRAAQAEVFSFLFRRSSEGWRVAYDTLLGDALPAYVYSLVQEQVAPGSDAPVPKAQIAARRISDRYRGLLSPEVEQRKPGKRRSTG
jgi:hypothetical protein